jgi:Holliday junction resolvase-like predicted endonuclease
MNPQQYEELVCQHFVNEGYNAVTTSYLNDYGIDIFATKGNEKIGIQVKMYGNGRKINRQMVMELHGAKDYFDCTRAIIATDGSFLKDAVLVAKKLKIGILNINSNYYPQKNPLLNNSNIDFETIWEKHIIPLQGKSLSRENGETNEIILVDWGEIHRLTSNGKKGKIKIEIFKHTVNKLLQEGYITRDYINQNYLCRASSGVILILSQVPFFQLTCNPTGLKFVSQLPTAHC